MFHHLHWRGYMPDMPHRRHSFHLYSSLIEAICRICHLDGTHRHLLYFKFQNVFTIPAPWVRLYAANNTARYISRVSIFSLLQLPWWGHMPYMPYRWHIRAVTLPVLLLRDDGTATPDLPTAMARYLQQDGLWTLQLPVQTTAET